MKIRDIAELAIKQIESGETYESCIAVLQAAEIISGTRWYVSHVRSPAVKAWQAFVYPDLAEDTAALNEPPFWNQPDTQEYNSMRINKLREWAALHGDEEVHHASR
ncbi:MAG TPA: hypothetical protein VM783_18020 [Candidatus Acidoferrum sp.]|nr:hypothetical protein [Candidatus Acidoferrum sp.]